MKIRKRALSNFTILTAYGRFVFDNEGFVTDPEPSTFTPDQVASLISAGYEVTEVDTEQKPDEKNEDENEEESVETFDDVEEKENEEEAEEKEAEEADSETPDLSKYTVKELKAFAKENDIEITEKLRDDIQAEVEKGLVK